MSLVDARGVEIAPGDTCLYGFSEGGGVAMAEAVVLGEGCDCPRGESNIYAANHRAHGVSLTPSGRVRLRVVRRSYSPGEKPIVDVAPDRLVVLKHGDYTDGWDSGSMPSLPLSPLPTQDEVARAKITDRIESLKQRLREKQLPSWWITSGDPDADMVEYLGHVSRELARERRKLKELDAST